MKLKNLLIIASCLLPGACSYVKPLPVLAPANLAAKCDDLNEFKGSSMGDLVQYTVYVIQSYKDCSTRHSALAEFNKTGE